MVLTGSKKFFSAGLDFDFVGKTLSKAHLILPGVTGLFHRVLLLNMPTVAAIGGHSFGAGPFLCLSCDYRLMRKDGGYICAPEAQMGVPLPLGWSAILKAKLLPNTMRTFVLTSKKYNSSEALDAQIIDAEIDTNDNDEFVGKCMEFAKGLTQFAKNRNNVKTMKKDLYNTAANELAKASQNHPPLSKL